MDIREESLDIEHREFLSEKLRSTGTALSEYCFPNLFLFRGKHEYRIISSGDDFFLSGLSYNKERYIMPLENLSTCSEQYLEKLISLAESDMYDCIFPVPEKWLERFPEDKFRREFILDDSEYIYNKEKLAEYPGRKLSKKRNLVKQFLRDNDPEVRIIDHLSLNHTIELLELWQERSPQEMGDSDYNSCIEGLKLHDELGLSGALFLTEGEPCGFIMGERAGENSYVIHFAKGDTEKKGIYQYMFQTYVRDYCSEVDIINLEQDMGMEGLRKTKHSYQPDRMLHKYRIYPL